jgi:hypothetical protein
MPMISMDGTENELVTVVIIDEIKNIFLLVSPHFLQFQLCRIIYDAWRDVWRRAGCSISDGRRERGNRVCVHDFFDSGRIATASTERGREPQWTQAMVLPYWIGNKGDVLEGGRAVVSLVLEQRPFFG